MTFQRFAILLAALGVAYFTVEGGEYGTSDLVRQRARRAALEAGVRELRGAVRDLRVEQRAIETDPAVQERIAREEFGLVRDRELLYRFTPDPAGADTLPDGARRP